jgi:4-hydroxy-2-oxoheptanedioate aldolase
MNAAENGFKSGLVGSAPLIGLWQGIASAITAEICANAGFDWLLFDGEHAPNTLTTLVAQLQAVAPYNVHPVARVPVGEAWLIKQYLDIGFKTLLVPFVESAEQAQQLARAMRYPPEGIRGIAPGLARAARWNTVPNYLEQANDGVCLIVQVETRAGLDALEDIAAVPGVDGIFIGPADLAASLGYRGQSTAPQVVTEIEAAIGRIVGTGMAAGIFAPDPEFARRCAALGCRFIAVGADVALLANAAASLARSAGAGGTVPQQIARY